VKIPRLLAVLALAIVLGACSLAQRPTPRPTLAPLPTLAPDDTPLPTPAPCSGTPELPAGGGVVTLTDFPLADALEVADVVWTGTHFVAVGFREMPDQGYDGTRQGIVWTSCDGVAWQEVVDPQMQYFTPLNVAAMGEDVYVLGTLATCGTNYEGVCEDVAEAGNVFMRSVAGGPWQRLPQDPEMQSAYDLVLEPIQGRLVAHGSSDDENLTYALWQSDNGETWRKTTDLAGMDPIYAVVAQGGGLIAFGDQYLDELEDSKLVIASSSDGMRFTPVTTAPEITGGTIYEAAQGPGGYAAVGVGYPDSEDFGVLGLALQSADGSAWSQATDSDSSFGDSQLEEVHALPDDSGYVAVGYRLDVEDFTAQLGKLWISTDGTSWRSLREFGTTASLYNTSAMGPHGLVIFSAEEDESAEEIDTGVSAYFVPLSEMTP
jgi:hypothetical protein